MAVPPRYNGDLGLDGRNGYKRLKGLGGFLDFRVNGIRAVFENGYFVAAVAAVNGIAVAIIVALNQPGDYPIKLLAVQIAVVLAALVLASRSRVIQGVGLLLTGLSVFLTFSAMFLYIPTLIAGLWRWASEQPSRDETA